MGDVKKLTLKNPKRDLHIYVQLKIYQKVQVEGTQIWKMQGL